MRRLLTCALVASAVLGLAPQSHAQATRLDAIWARSTAGQHIKLDGVLDEAAWSKAESYTVRYAKNNGDPGSGWKEEAGRLARDSTFAVIKFLVQGDSLFLGITARDSSIGGSDVFNREDGVIMDIKDHRDPNATSSGPLEYLYSWWHPQIPSLNAPGGMPGYRGYWSSNNDSIPPTADQLEAWTAVTKVRGGLSNSDSDIDSSYVIEMRIDVGKDGYHPSAAGGDVIEWNISVYDTDWMWPLVGARFSANRAWWQDPWGNDMWYDQVKIFARPDVTVNSGAAPFIGPDVTIPNAGGYAAPTIDGFLTEPVWSGTQHFDIRYGDVALRDTYGDMRWRAGQYQPTVNGAVAEVVDPGDATIHWFFKGDSLYIGFDVRDQVVQYHTLQDRWDGFDVTIEDTTRYSDHNLTQRSLGFHVGPNGSVIADGYLPFLRDTALGAKVGLKLKPGTTVDTLGQTNDQGYTAELMVNLRKLGYPAGLGTRPLWIGITMYDGDSYTTSTNSYGTRTWYGRERTYRCCPATAYLDPNSFVTAVEDPRGGPVGRAALLGNFPNPFRSFTLLKFSLPARSNVMLEVYDLQGRNVASRALGMRPAGAGQTSFAPVGLGTGIYLYRLKLADPVSGKATGTMMGKMMVLK